MAVLMAARLMAATFPKTRTPPRGATMRRAGTVLALLAAFVFGAAAPAGAQTFDRSRYVGPTAGGLPVSPLDGGTSPTRSCLANDNTVILHGPFGDEEFQLPSLEACISSLLRGRVSWLAFFQNCQELEGFFALENPSGRPYPYSFYGNPDYTAANRIDCIYFLWSFHTGRLTPGPGGG